jgi:hypothetical protein
VPVAKRGRVWLKRRTKPPAFLRARCVQRDLVVHVDPLAGARDPMVVAARLEEERDRANGFAGYEADWGRGSGRRSKSPPFRLAQDSSYNGRYTCIKTSSARQSSSV